MQCLENSKLRSAKGRKHTNAPPKKEMEPFRFYVHIFPSVSGWQVISSLATIVNARFAVRLLAIMMVKVSVRSELFGFLDGENIICKKRIEIKERWFITVESYI